MKKFLAPALVIVIIIQLFAPVYMIIGKYDVLKNGEEFKFRVYAVDPYDAFRGRYVALNARQEARDDGKYGVIRVDADGFASVAYVTEEKPSSVPYVKSVGRHGFALPIDRYYMEEKLAPRAERLTSGNEAYVTVRVKKGKLVISGLYIDGVAIEDIIRNM